LKSNLKEWNKFVFGNIHGQVKEAETKVRNIDDQIESLGLTNNLQNLQKLAHINLDKALDR